MLVGSDFFTEINAPMAIHPDYIDVVARMANSSKHIAAKAPEMHAMEIAMYAMGGMPVSASSAKDQSEAVAVIPVTGLLSRDNRIDWEEYAYRYGTNSIANKIQEAFDNPAIKAIVLDMFTPGGSTHAAVPIKGVLKKRNKPVITAVNSMAFSAGYYLASFTDMIIATDEMAQVGSIGVMAQFDDIDGYLAEMKVRRHVIIPPESSWKNKAYLDAKKDKYETMYSEDLSPWAVHFQNTVKESRKKLDLSVDGIIEGRTFYAFDAVKNGLVDDIMPMPDIITKAFELASRDKALNKLFN